MEGKLLITVESIWLVFMKKIAYSQTDSLFLSIRRSFCHGIQLQRICVAYIYGGLNILKNLKKCL